MKGNIYINSVDRVEAWRYNLPTISQQVENSGGIVQCSTENTNIASTAKDASLFPRNLERSSKKIMWNDFLSLEALIRASLCLRKRNGRSRNQDLNRFRSRIARPGSLTGSIFPEPARSIVTGREEF